MGKSAAAAVCGICTGKEETVRAKVGFVLTLTSSPGLPAEAGRGYHPTQTLLVSGRFVKALNVRPVVWTKVPGDWRLGKKSLSSLFCPVSASRQIRGMK